MPRFERLALRPTIAPMEARPADAIPRGEEWRYEPKWDGFRCVAFRDGDDVELQSKSAQPLTRYFPDVVAHLRSLREQRFVLDGELAIATEEGFDFDALLQRIHPAEKRVRMLSTRTPAGYAVFDLLVAGKHAWHERRLDDRRNALEDFFSRVDSGGGIDLSPQTSDIAAAGAWLTGDVRRTDGVIAKRNVPYAFGSRDAMVKIKRAYTADCVIGGFRGDPASVASLLLGLYDRDGLLHHVGFVGSMSADVRKRASTLLRPLIGSPGFTGSAPGGPSRWRRAGESAWHPVRPAIVAEVAFDHVTGQRFRHAARFLRWRPDKDPKQCTMEQMGRP